MQVTSHVRCYIKYLLERGKYTSDKSLDINYSNRQEDYKKPIQPIIQGI